MRLIRNARNAPNVPFKIKRSARELARRTNLGANVISRIVRLGEGLDEFPELDKYNSADLALKKLESFRQQKNIFESEADLQKFLEKNWNTTNLSDEWILDERGHVNTGEVGIIDLLARHKHRPAWLVIELKVSRPCDDVIGQVLRYMGWIKQKCAKPGDSIEGLIIAQEPDTKTLYGLECISNVRMSCYRVDSGTLTLREVDLNTNRPRSLNDFTVEELQQMLEQRRRSS